MPLDFTKPRAEPTLGRKDRAELVAEARPSKYTSTAIRWGLRRQGGPWKQRDPEEQRRIDRYVKDLALREVDPTHNPRNPDGWVYPSHEELIHITDAVLSNREETFVRACEPQVIRVIRDEPHNAITIQLVVRDGTDQTWMSQQRVSKEDMRRYNVDAINVVDNMMATMYRDLSKKTLEANGRAVEQVKPIMH